MSCRWLVGRYGKLIDDAIHKALHPTTTNHRKQIQGPDKEIPLLLTFNPNNPQITNQLSNLFQSLKSHHLTKNIYKNSSLKICRRQPPNLKKLLTRAKIPSPNQNSHTHSTKRCNRNRCKCCESLIECSTFTFPHNNKTIKIQHNTTCLSKFIVYALLCGKCKKHYIGLTTTYLCSRVTLHRTHINHPTEAPLFVSKHIAQCAQNQNPPFLILPIYQIQDQCITTLRRMEKFFIQKLKPPLNVHQSLTTTT